MTRICIMNMPIARRRPYAAIAAAGIAALLTACAVTAADSAAPVSAELEEIYVLRSVRESHDSVESWCSSSKTGFEPLATDAERLYSFWSVRLRPDDGMVLDARTMRVAKLRACFGPTTEPARQNFYAEISLGSRSFRGHGECLALKTHFPRDGLFPVRCQLVLSGLPPPYVGGILTTNTMTSQAAYGGETSPPGYAQASIATIRIWKTPVRGQP
jgi:hypothetical protein